MGLTTNAYGIMIGVMGQGQSSSSAVLVLPSSVWFSPVHTNGKDHVEWKVFIKYC